MILSLEQILQFIEKPQASSLLEDASVFHAKHRLHILGEGFQDTLKRLDGLENHRHSKIKEAVARPTTIRIFKQILNQFKKTFRASGTFKDYEFKDDNLKQDFIEYLKDVGGGLTINELMRIVWFKAVFEDFNGVFLIELPIEQKGEFAEPFPVFKGLDHIHDIEVIGQKVEYIIFSWVTKDKSGKKTKHYRVIDDFADYHFIKEAGEKEAKLAKRTILNEQGEPEEVDDIVLNIWGYVPAIQPSQLNYSIDNDILKKSYIQEVMGNADNYLSISNGHSVSIKLHQHPLVVGFPVTCGACNGKQHHLVDQELIECKTCNGTGKMDFMHKDPSLGITLPEPQEGEGFEAKSPVIYVTPDLKSMAEQRIEMELEEKNIEKGVLGAEGILARETKQQTENSKLLDRQPTIDLLTGFSVNGQEVEKFITDTIAIARYNDSNDTGTRFIGSTINWGKKFFLKTTSEIEQEYKEAKEAGVPISTLSEMLDELIHTKFENNPMLLKRSMILKELEPFPTYTAKEVKDLGVDPIDLNIKIYFNDYIERFERENADVVVFKENVSFDKKLDEINKIIKGYAEEKLPKPEPEVMSISDRLSIEEKKSRGLLDNTVAKELINSN